MSGKSVQKLVLAGAGPGHLLREIGSWCGEWSIYISSASSVSRQTDMAAMLHYVGNGEYIMYNTRRYKFNF